jgi:hypothetical protein
LILGTGGICGIYDERQDYELQGLMYRLANGDEEKEVCGLFGGR